MSYPPPPPPPPPPPSGRPLSGPPSATPPPYQPPQQPVPEPGWGPPAYGGYDAYPPPQPPRRSRALPIALAVAAALVLVAVAVLVPLVLGDEDTGTASEVSAVEEDVDTSNLDEVQEYDDLDPTHVPGEVDYPQSPPVGGNHDPAWLECGAYDVPVREENVVHDLEHGTIWITYRDDEVDAEGVARLEEQLPDNGILSPYPDQEAPVVITAWGRQLDLTGPDDPRIGLFVGKYGAGETAPEPFASCNGGLTDPEGSGTGADA